jgi:hypothetical protein
VVKIHKIYSRSAKLDTQLFSNMSTIEKSPKHMVSGLAPCRYIRIPAFAQISGYTEKAIHRKIEEGVWIEGRQYHRAPDGRLLIDIQGYEEWVSSK